MEDDEFPDDAVVAQYFNEVTVAMMAEVEKFKMLWPKVPHVIVMTMTTAAMLSHLQETDPELPEKAVAMARVMLELLPYHRVERPV